MPGCAAPAAKTLRAVSPDRSVLAPMLRLGPAGPSNFTLAVLWITLAGRRRPYDGDETMTRGPQRSLSRPIARVAVGAAALALCAVALTCGPKQPPRTATPASSLATTLPDGGPAPPTAGLGFPGLAVAWTPPMLSAGDPQALAAALARRGEVTLLLGPRLSGAAWEQRGDALVGALSPTTQVVGRRHAALQELVELGPALQAPRRELGPEGRPRYAAPSLHPTWPKGQETLLAIDDAPVEPAAWQALPALSVGSCEPAMQALAEGQEQALAQLGPFLDHADRLLWTVYRAQLQAFVPGLVGELAAYEQARVRGDFADEESWAQHQCGRAYWEHVQRYATCGDDAASCPGAPRLVLVGGARIAAPEAPLPVGDHCPALVGRDHAAEIRRLGQAAAESASEALGREWTVLADRLGALTEVHAALEDICTPRRRRFAEADLAEARTRLARIGAGLASDDLQVGAGRWQIRDEPLLVPGLGPSRELARYAAGPTSVNAGVVADARALRDFVLARSMCRSGHSAAPLAVVLAEPHRAVDYFGFFYEEELFCGSLPPLALAP